MRKGKDPEPDPDAHPDPYLWLTDPDAYPGGQKTYGSESGTLPSGLLFGREIIQRFKIQKFDAYNCVTAQARQAQWREEAETALANLPDPDCPPGHVRQAPLMSL